jgi:hypothetical protein
MWHLNSAIFRHSLRSLDSWIWALQEQAVRHFGEKIESIENIDRYRDMHLCKGG